MIFIMDHRRRDHDPLTLLITLLRLRDLRLRLDAHTAKRVEKIGLRAIVQPREGIEGVDADLPRARVVRHDPDDFRRGSNGEVCSDAAELDPSHAAEVGASDLDPPSGSA